MWGEFFLLSQLFHFLGGAIEWRVTHGEFETVETDLCLIAL